MSKTIRRASSTSTIVAAPFTLALPPEFDKKPDFVVELPGKREARIWNDKVEADKYIDGLHQTVEVDGFRVVFFNKDGDVISPGTNDRYGHGSYVFQFAHWLKLHTYLNSAAVSYRPKKRTVVEEDRED